MSKNRHLVVAGDKAFTVAAVGPVVCPLEAVINASTWKPAGDECVFATAVTTARVRRRVAVSTALQGLMDAYEFLGDQLSLEWGLLTQEDFDQIEEAYLGTLETADSETVRETMHVFLDAVDVDPDPDLLSRMFRCKLEDALAVQKVRHGRRRRANAAVG